MTKLLLFMEIITMQKLRIVLYFRFVFYTDFFLNFKSIKVFVTVKCITTVYFLFNISHFLIIFYVLHNFSLVQS